VTRERCIHPFQGSPILFQIIVTKLLFWSSPKINDSRICYRAGPNDTGSRSSGLGTIESKLGLWSRNSNFRLRLQHLEVFGSGSKTIRSVESNKKYVLTRFESHRTFLPTHEEESAPCLLRHWGRDVPSWSARPRSVDVGEPGNNVVDELWSFLLEEELTSRIPLGVLMPRIIILSPVLQTSVAVEAFHAISNCCK